MFLTDLLICISVLSPTTILFCLLPFFLEFTFN